MAVEHNIRSNFVFAPPEDNTSAWQASVETFKDALERAFPEAFMEMSTSSLRNAPVLDFEIEVAPEVFVTGTAAMPASDYAHISLIDVTADEAALFAQWLRDSYVPSPVSVRFLSSFVMENGDEAPWPLPATGDAAAIEAVMRDHLTAAGAA
ncbi:hypothetical protein ACFYRY_41040 [Streptomyces sp. NPDC005263]|uniref:hypothetical protein n=1 Tax=Streptomyces sp. NPDC005263 TaxID=3364711 RepID=UPI0036741CA6